MASTMKKQAKATAVKKGTYYECRWCGQEGANAPHNSTQNKVVCGRLVEEESLYFCSVKCQHIYSAEHNRREVIRGIDWTSKALDGLKALVAICIKKGEKIEPVVLQSAKLLNIYKKVFIFILKLLFICISFHDATLRISYKSGYFVSLWRSFKFCF